LPPCREGGGGKRDNVKGKKKKKTEEPHSRARAAVHTEKQGKDFKGESGLVFF